MNNFLSTDSDALICVLYAEYLSRRSHGLAIDAARNFSSDKAIHDSFLPDWLPEDVNTVCGWLIEKEFLTAMQGDENYFDIFLTEEGIIYMESRFSRKRESVISHIRELVDIGVAVANTFLQ